MSDSHLPSHSLHWLERLFPGYFALVMATGILSFAFRLADITLLADLLFGGAVLAWLILVVLSSWRLLKFPGAVKADLLNIRLVFSFFTLVAATSIIGILLSLRGYDGLAVICWMIAFLAWTTLLYLSFSVLTFLTHPHTVNIVHGGWLIAIVATQSLVLLGVEIAPYFGEYADYMLVEVHLLWSLGLVLYGIFVTLFCYRIFFQHFEPEDISPLLWVIMGAAAIGVSAGTSLLNADIKLSFLLALRPFIDGMVMILWS